MSSKEGKFHKEYKRKHHNKKSPNSYLKNDSSNSENGTNFKNEYEKKTIENLSQEENQFVMDLGISSPVESSITKNSLNKYLYQESANDFMNDSKEKRKIAHNDRPNSSNYTEDSAKKICKGNDISKDTKCSQSEMQGNSSPSIDSNNDFEVIEKENFEKMNEFGDYGSSSEIDNKRTNLNSDLCKTDKERDSSPYTMIDENDMQSEIKIEKIKNQEISLDVEISDSINKEKSIQRLNNNSSESFDKSKEKSKEKSQDEIECRSSQNQNTQEIQCNTYVPILTKLKNSSDNLNFNSIRNEPENIQMSSSKTNDIIIEDKDNIIHFKKSSSDTNTDIIRESNNEEERKSIFERLLNTNLEPKHQFRICIVGDSNVGKTSLLMRYCDDTFKNSMTNTIGVDFRVLMLKYNNENIKVQIWDTAGQERFKSISMNYFKSADAFMFVYDVANRSTFENLKNWIEIVEQNNKHSICNFVVGNKCDLEESREVSIEEGKKFAFNSKFNFMETSAKLNKNVELAFEISTLKLLENCQLEIENTQNPVKRSPTYPIEDGNKFKIDEMSEENLNSKKARKDVCRC